MNRMKQKAIVWEMARSLAKDLCAKIQAGKIPDHWDGHELRVLFADKAEEGYASMSALRREPRRIRALDFKNTCRINNL